MDLDSFRQLLTDVAELVPISEIREYADGPAWTLAVDEETAVFVEWVGNRRAVVVYSEIGALMEDRATAMEHLLYYNGAWRETGGLRFALDPDDTVTLAYDLPLEGIDPEVMAASLSTMIEAVRGWSQIFDRASTAGWETSASEIPGQRGQGFLRV
ncbi:MAG: type III secretion system chaperone [Pseudomonadota bacterium]